MQNNSGNINRIESSSLDAMMERYLAEMLRYQRATAPGRQTLEIVPAGEVADISGEDVSADIVECVVVDSAEELQAENEAEVTENETQLSNRFSDMKIQYNELCALEEEDIRKIKETFNLPRQPEIIEKTESAAPSKYHIGEACSFEKCVGAFGTFRTYERNSSLTRASFLQNPGDATEVFAKFSADIPCGGGQMRRAAAGE